MPIPIPSFIPSAPSSPSHSSSSPCISIPHPPSATSTLTCDHLPTRPTMNLRFFSRSTASSSHQTTTSLTTPLPSSPQELNHPVSLVPPGSPASHQSLYDIVLPGTHDSAAYQTRPDLISRSTVLPLCLRPIRRACASVQSDFALTQNLSILDQLRAGARFLDIRVSKPPHNSTDSQFWTIHGMVLCVPLADVIAQINAFHDETAPHRCLTVVTVFRSYLLDDAEDKQLADFVLSLLKHPHFEGSSDDLRRVSLNDLPRNVIAGLRGSRLDVAWGQDAWLDTYSADKKISFLHRTLATTKHRNLRNDLFVLGWTVTPSVLDITFRVASLGFLRPAVKVEAVKMNERFSDFFATFRDPMQERVNVIFFDCFSAKHAQIVRTLNGAATDTDDSAVS